MRDEREREREREREMRERRERKDISETIGSLQDYILEFNTKKQSFSWKGILSIFKQ